MQVYAAHISNNCILKWLPSHRLGIFRFFYKKKQTQALQSFIIRDRFEYNPKLIGVFLKHPKYVNFTSDLQQKYTYL